jgi:hypothetical protein
LLHHPNLQKGDRVMKLYGLFGLLLFTLAAEAWAASPQQQAAHNIPDAKSYNEHFGNMDPNNDGKVNWEEFKAHFPKADAKIFSAIDLNKDGAIDHDEWHEFKAAYGLKHKD